MTALDEVFSTNEKELILYERPDSGIVLSDDKELIEQAQKDRREHYVAVKENLTELIDNVRTVVLDAVTEVRTNPSARMYETFALLTKTYAELNTQLLEIPQKIRTPESETDRPNINQNAFFIGTSEQVVDLIKKKQVK